MCTFQQSNVIWIREAIDPTLPPGRNSRDDAAEGVPG
jgi:hypothetical protein